MKQLIEIDVPEFMEFQADQFRVQLFGFDGWRNLEYSTVVSPDTDDGRPLAWLVTSKNGLIRCAWTETPTEEQLDICDFDGDTVTPLYREKKQLELLPAQSPRQLTALAERDGDCLLLRFPMRDLGFDV